MRLHTDIKTQWRSTAGVRKKSRWQSCERNSNWRSDDVHHKFNRCFLIEGCKTHDSVVYCNNNRFSYYYKFIYLKCSINVLLLLSQLARSWHRKIIDKLIFKTESKSGLLMDVPDVTTKWATCQIIPCTLVLELPEIIECIQMESRSIIPTGNGKSVRRLEIAGGQEAKGHE